jgi:F420-dependent oxidoreductase-like protein
MLEVAMMLEGQNGLNWERWQRWGRAVEDLGFVGLYRSDHFTNPHPPDLDSLELWVSLTWLAGHTERIEFGPMVAPVSFRNPIQMARMALAVDDLSRGRLTLGLGAGWQEREHANYGFDLLPVPQRFARFEEALQVTQQLLHSDTPIAFDGAYYHLNDAILLPHPLRRGGPPILIGGNGAKRTLPLVARYADEWNAVFLPAQTFAERNAELDDLLRDQKRDPQSVRRSMMTGLIFGQDQAALERRLNGRDPAELREHGMIVGTASEVVEQLGALAEAGVGRVMLQWLDLDDMDGLEALAAQVLRQVGS